MHCLLRLVVAWVIAAVTALIGLEWIVRLHGDTIDLSTRWLVMARSVVLWTVLSLPLRRLPSLVGVFLGALSPFLGALMIHPFAILVVFTHLGPSLCVGIVTGTSIAISFWAMDYRSKSAPFDV